MSKSECSSEKDDATKVDSDSSKLNRESSSMTQSWIENNHNEVTIKIRPRHKANLSLDLLSLDKVLKDLDQAMPESSDSVKEPLTTVTDLTTQNNDLDFATLPRRKRHGKGIAKTSAKHPDIVLSSEKIQQICFRDEEVQNKILESPKCYSPTIVPWQSLTDIAEVEHSKIGLVGSSNIAYPKIFLDYNKIYLFSYK